MSVGEGFSLADPCCPFFLPPLRSSGGREELEGRYSNEMEVTVPGTDHDLACLH